MLRRGQVERMQYGTGTMRWIGHRSPPLESYSTAQNSTSLQLLFCINNDERPSEREWNRTSGPSQAFRGFVAIGN